VYSNTTGQPYPVETEAVRRLLTDHLLKSVELVRQIERMHSDGARVFVELGPKSVLTGLVGQILGGRQYLAVALDGGGGLRGVLSALGTLVANGVALDLARLFEAREVQDLNLARLAELYGRPALSPNAWLVSGGCARPQKEAARKTGKIPALKGREITILELANHTSGLGRDPPIMGHAVSGSTLWTLAGCLKVNLIIPFSATNISSRSGS